MSAPKKPKLKLAWAIDREPEFDLREFAYGVLETAKDNLREDKELAAAAFVVTEAQIKCFETGFQTSEEKEEIYNDLVRTARRLKAVAVVSLSDAYWGEKYDPATYYPGKLAEEGRECIFVCVSAPSLESWTLTARYKRIGEKIVYEPTEEEHGTQFNLMGSWPKEMREIQ